MTSWLVRKFVRDYDKTEELEVRESYGTLGSCVGILLNLLLAAAKYLMGVLSGSLAITADAANNFSDAAGSIVALISVRMANKPVDEEHPFGHGRMEYIGALGVGALIVLMGVSLLRDGINAIITPGELQISWLVVGILAVSIAAKLWLFFFYRKIGRTISNNTLLAASKDSISDVLATSAVLLSLILQYALGWRIDGWIGVLVALVVLKAGYEVCRDTVGSLLGGKPDPEKSRRLRELLMKYDGILGVHDLVVHDYGPGRCFASVHAEVSEKCDIVSIHEIIDTAEREIGEKLRMPICIHMDPIATDDEETNEVRGKLAEYLRSFDPALTLHDFRLVHGQDNINLIFDCVLPAGYKRRAELLENLKAYAFTLDERYRLVVQFDTDFT